jgi:hypothetical protein
VLDDHPDLALLKTQILDRLQEGQASLAELKEYALTETVFKSVHAVSAVEALVIAKKVLRSSARRHEDVIVKLAPTSLF